MSGICGILRFGPCLKLQDELHRMNHAMISLGPDGTGIWQDGQVGFGCQAFYLTQDAINKIIPHYDESSKIAITVDCRLDNRKELCHHFLLKDEHSLSDVDLILRAYKKWGKNCPQYLLGEFAIAIWDETLQELIFFIDHTGQRELYYYHDSNLFAFASTPHALHAIKAIRRKPNLHRIAVKDNLGYMLNHPELTFYENIHKISARTLYTIKNTTLNSSIYWQPDLDRRIHFSSKEEYIEAFQDLFSTIVRSKLRSHCPTFTLHSGGLDSSSITAMAANLLSQEGKQLTALSAMLPRDYKGKMDDESHFIYLLQKSNLNILPVTDLWRGPFDELKGGDSRIMGIERNSRYYLYRAFATAASAHGARIILDGSHGEKGPSFYGYGCYAELLRNFHWYMFSREIWLHSKKYNKSIFKCVIKDGILPFLPKGTQNALRNRARINQLQRPSFLHPSFIDANIENKTLFQLEELDLNTQYPNHRLHQYRLMSRLNSYNPIIHDDNGRPVHISCPYNDKRMFEFCLAMPGNLKIRDGFTRYPIRCGMKGLMPDNLLERKTTAPFSPDYHERYNRQRVDACEFITNTPKTPLIKKVIDVKKLELALKLPMQTNKCHSNRDFMAMHSIPFAVYLMAFLASFNGAM